MRNYLLILIVAGLAFASSCTNAAAPPVVVNKAPVNTKPAQTGHEDHEGHDAPRITLADAKKAFDAGTAVFVDTHVKQAYDVEHIKGAINITVQDLDAKFNSIPKGKKIIAYCS